MKFFALTEEEASIINFNRFTKMIARSFRPRNGRGTVAERSRNGRGTIAERFTVTETSWRRPDFDYRACKSTAILPQSPVLFSSASLQTRPRSEFLIFLNIKYIIFCCISFYGCSMILNTIIYIVS